MSRQQQINLLKRLLNYVETRTTSMADAPWRNDASVYADPDHLAREQQILFRQHPLLMGFASKWAKPGAFSADDYAGVPILMARGRDGTLRAFLNVCRHRGAKIAQGCGETSGTLNAEQFGPRIRACERRPRTLSRKSSSRYGC